MKFQLCEALFPHFLPYLREFSEFWKFIKYGKKKKKKSLVWFVFILFLHDKMGTRYPVPTTQATMGTRDTCSTNKTIAFYNLGD